MSRFPHTLRGGFWSSGMFFAIIIAKHLYGGLGPKPFNPAMVAYVVLLIIPISK
ncbi:RnfABCDGE type electron transport complex subunit D [Vibrio lentus]|nr:RnfABCDGE type electron transport complex subunit D [Vibrio lentus]